MLLTSDIKFTYVTKDGETLTVTMREPNTTQFDQFRRSKYHGKSKRGFHEMEDHTVAARIALIDAILEDVQGCDVAGPEGEKITLGKNCVLSDHQREYLTTCFNRPIHTWKDVIPPRWKDKWAERFEEGDLEENSVPLGN